MFSSRTAMQTRNQVTGTAIQPKLCWSLRRLMTQLCFLRSLVSCQVAHRKKGYESFGRTICASEGFDHEGKIFLLRRNSKCSMRKRCYCVHHFRWRRRKFIACVGIVSPAQIRVGIFVLSSKASRKRNHLEPSHRPLSCSSKHFINHEAFHPRSFNLQ
jgi:hypothetical protein